MADSPRWKSLVDDLLRLAQDDGATEDERATARLKIRQILERHPEAEQIRQYEPVREFTFGDVGYMKRNNIPLEGSWTGATLEEAALSMVTDYRRRIERFDRRPKQLPVTIQEIDRWMAECQAEIADCD